MSTETIVIALVAVLVGSLLKSISGMGLPLIAIPALSLVADVETAVAVVALPNLALNLALAWRTRASRHETRDLPSLGGFGVVGAVIGTFVLVSWPEEPLVAALVIVVVGYGALFVRSPEYRLAPTTTRRWAPGIGFGAGVLQGAIGISGPVVGSWVHAYRLSRSAHIFSITVLFALSGGAQFVTLAASGELGNDRWIVALVGCIPALATVPTGERLRNRFSSEGFDRFVVGTLTAMVLVLAVRTFV